jgi:transcriptional regulator with AAA-type ATPase domain
MGARVLVPETSHNIDVCVLRGGAVVFRSEGWDARWGGGAAVMTEAAVVRGLCATSGLTTSELEALLRGAEPGRLEFVFKRGDEEARLWLEVAPSVGTATLTIADTSVEWAERGVRLALTELAVARALPDDTEPVVDRWLAILHRHLRAARGQRWSIERDTGLLVLQRECTSAGLGAVASREVAPGDSAASRALASGNFVRTSPGPEAGMGAATTLSMPWCLGAERGVFVFTRSGGSLPKPAPTTLQRLLSFLCPDAQSAHLVSPAGEALQRAARTDSNVLLLGETGTGKTRLARQLHDASARAGRPFVELNCASLNAALVESELFGHERGAFTGAANRKAGLLEVAGGGTVFLDEVGELEPRVQATLLKVLETHRLRRVGGTAEVSVDFRLVVATHRDLRAEVAAGTFRADLYFRLNVLTVAVPPLRERAAELPGLARELVEDLRGVTRWPSLRLDDGALPLLLGYAWPGNVRELRNALERAASFSTDGLVTDDHVRRALTVVAPPAGEQPRPTFAEGVAPMQSLDEERRRLTLEAFERSGRNLSKTARVLGLPRTTLRSWLRRFGAL